MSDDQEKTVGLAMRFIASFDEKEAEDLSLSPLNIANRVLALGPSLGPHDTIETRTQFLMEQDAKAAKH